MLKVLENKALYFHPKVLIPSCNAALLLVCLWMVLPYLFVKPIAGFDEAFNLQVANNISNYFVYAPTYQPTQIYDSRITMNGPMQYFAAACFKIFGVETGYLFALTGIAFLLLYSVARLSLAVLVGVTLLFISWPQMRGLSTSFLGEICSTAFCLLGYRYYKLNLAHKRWAVDQLLIASFFFGSAIATKLVAVLVVPFILVAALYYQHYLVINGWTGVFKEISKDLITAAVTFISSILIFICWYYFSVLHSLLMLHTVNVPLLFRDQTETLWAFIRSHFWQQSEAVASNTIFSNYFTNPNLAVLLGGGFLLLAFVKPTGTFIVLSLAFAAYSGALNERRAFLLIFLSLIMIFEACGEIFNSAEGKGRIVQYFGVPFAASILCLYTYRSLPIIRERLHQSNFWVTSLLSGAKNVAPLVSSVDIDLQKILLRSTSPILAGGWWQFPEESLASNKIFYDRMQPETAKVISRKQRLLLIWGRNFQSIWPFTGQDFCAGKPLFDNGKTVLCRWKRKRQLNEVGNAN